MKIKYLYIDKNDKIMLTRAELEEIMREKYDEGYEAAKAAWGGSLQQYYHNPYENYVTCCDSNIATTRGQDIETNKK